MRFYNENVGKTTYESTLFPAPARVDKLMNFEERVIVQNTDAFRGSIAMNLVQSISNRRRCHFESTMSLFHCAEIYEQCGDSSMGPGGRATFECFSATRRLRGGLRLLVS